MVPEEPYRWVVVAALTPREELRQQPLSLTLPPISQSSLFLKFDHCTPTPLLARAKRLPGGGSDSGRAALAFDTEGRWLDLLC